MLVKTIRPVLTRVQRFVKISPSFLGNIMNKLVVPVEE